MSARGAGRRRRHGLRRRGDADRMRGAGRVSSSRTSTPGRSRSAYRDGVRDGCGAARRGARGRPGDPWVAPIVQEVWMPARVVDGVLIPAHREWVVIHPAEWRRSPRSRVDASPAGPRRRVAATVTARGPRPARRDDAPGRDGHPSRAQGPRHLRTDLPRAGLRRSPPSGVRLRIDPRLARVAAPAEPPMPVAPTRRAYVVPVRWPAGAPPVVAFVGHDAGQPGGRAIAAARARPSTCCRPRASTASRRSARRAARAASAIAGTAGARRLGIQAVPAVVRVVDGVAHVTEGAP